MTAPVALPPVVTAPAAASEIVSVGPDGVWVQGPGGASEISSDAYAIGLRDPSGAILVQQHSGFGPWTAADTTPMLIETDQFGSRTTRELWPGRDRSGWIRIHDLELVGGHRILLFEVQAEEEGLDSRSSELFAADLDDDQTVALGPVGGWEDGVGRLHLASNGWIVGEHLGTRRSMFTAVLPDSTTTPPTPADVGVEPFTEDCGSACPHAFTVTNDGSTIAWLDGDGALHLWDVATQREVGDAIALGEAARAAVDLDVGAGVATLSPVTGLTPGGPARIVAIGPGHLAELPGSVATISSSSTIPWGLVVPSHPQIGSSDCTASSAGEGSARVGLFVRFRWTRHAVQLLGDPVLGTSGPYAIVERFFEGQRPMYDPAAPDPQFVIGGRAGRVYVGPYGQGEVQVILDDGSELYLRARGFTIAQLIATASALSARPVDAAVPGFDFAPPPGSGLALLDETDDLHGSAVRTSCATANGVLWSLAVLGGSPVYQYGVALDWLPLDTLTSAADGSVVAVRSANNGDRAWVFETIRGADDATWDRLTHVTPSVGPPSP